MSGDTWSLALISTHHIKDIDVSSTHATDMTSSPEDLSFADPVLQLWSHRFFAKQRS